MLLEVLESIDLKSSVTSVRFWIAINEVRLGELEEVSGLDEMSTLHGSGG